MWDERYSSDHYIYGTSPNDFLAASYQRIPANGQVLCLAEGEGRNAVFLARQGYQVTAVDQSRIGLNKAQKLAEEQGVSINCIQADLASFALGENHWDGIVSIFCHLPPAVRARVHQQLPTALKPGGVLLLEAYTPDQVSLGTGGPPDPEMMMSRETLQRELAGLKFQHLEELQREVMEGSHHTGRGAVVQLIASKERKRYAVSANRGQSSHKVRYVESGGGNDDEKGCRVCAPMVPPKPDPED